MFERHSSNVGALRAHTHIIIIIIIIRVIIIMMMMMMSLIIITGIVHRHCQAESGPLRRGGARKWGGIAGQVRPANLNLKPHWQPGPNFDNLEAPGPSRLHDACSRTQKPRAQGNLKPTGPTARSTVPASVTVAWDSH